MHCHSFSSSELHMDSFATPHQTHRIARISASGKAMGFGGGRVVQKERQIARDTEWVGSYSKAHSRPLTV